MTEVLSSARLTPGLREGLRPPPRRQGFVRSGLGRGPGVSAWPPLPVAPQARWLAPPRRRARAVATGPRRPRPGVAASDAVRRAGPRSRAWATAAGGTRGSARPGATGRGRRGGCLGPQGMVGKRPCARPPGLSARAGAPWDASSGRPSRRLLGRLLETSRRPRGPGPGPPTPIPATPNRPRSHSGGAEEEVGRMAGQAGYAVERPSSRSCRQQGTEWPFEGWSRR